MSKKEYIKPEINVTKVINYKDLPTIDKDNITKNYLNNIADNIFTLRALFNCEDANTLEVIFVIDGKDNHKICINRVKEGFEIITFVYYKETIIKLKEFIYKDLYLPWLYEIKDIVSKIFN